MTLATDCASTLAAARLSGNIPQLIVVVLSLKTYQHGASLNVAYCLQKNS